ncbi:hypothetical protein B0H16DRAFT_1550715 [Mycena metata]|uniref:Yeast cell wall synthesis Kre9/Knh1-like N-terminal domain-containing protein n=1 Tax=Mycena metata TaxID=1033252 RepID=A0AAD7IUD7_9AGAR|nr:hypothetical protein B0H16DRAFT_1550693 [Mycena metata]KAJ7749958.1 hypothetical protein B0H16DRAFT_1550715 [Mycena metata]
MRFATIVSSLVPLALATVALAGPTPLDVFSPPITFPTAGTVLVSKTETTVTWDASGAPVNISNKALLMLRKGDLTAPFILAEGFDLRTGALKIVVPNVLADSDYEFVLLGDSGNFSPTFTIQSDVPA